MLFYLSKDKRKIYEKHGYSYNEHLAINDMKEHIYSYQTMKTYQQQVGYFGDWLISHGYKRISLEENKDHI